MADHLGDAENAAAAGDWGKAREILLRALDADPNSPDLHGRMAFYTFNAGRAGLSDGQRLTEHHLNQSRKLGASLPFHLYWSGRIAVAQGNQPRARSQWEAALAMAPDFAPARQAIDRFAAGPRKTRTLGPGKMPGVGKNKVPSAGKKRTVTLVLVIVLIAAGVAVAIYG